MKNPDIKDDTSEKFLRTKINQMREEIFRKNDEIDKLNENITI